MAKKNKKSYVEQVLSGDYEPSFAKESLTGYPYKETAVTPKNNIVGKRAKQKDGWFQGGAFSNGYDFGDVTKTILGTSSDIYQDVVKGILNIGESALDLGTYGVASAFDHASFLNGGILNKIGDKDNKEIEESLKNFGQRNLIEETGIANRIAQNSPTGILNNLVQGNWDSLNPFDTKKYIESTASDIPFENSSVLGEKGDQIGQGVGYITGMTGLQAIGVPWQVTAGVTSMGSEMTEAFNDNATYGEAFVSGLISAVSEIGSEYMFGGTGKIIGAGALDDVVAGNAGKLVKKLSKSKAFQTIAESLVKAGGEGVEEVISGLGSAIGQKLTYMNDKEISEIYSSEEALNDFINGALVSGIIQTPGTISSTKQGRSTVTNLTDTEQQVVDSEIEKRIAEQETNGKKLTTREKTKIKEQVQEDLKKGYISVEDIENTLMAEDNFEIESLQQRLAEETDPKAKADLQSLINLNELNKQTKLDDLLSKNQLLQESYNEQARKGQQFTYEANENDSEYKKAIMQDAQTILNDTKRSHELVDTISKIAEDRKTKYRLINNEQIQELGYGQDGKTVNGLVTKDGEILINVDSPKALNTIVGHETTHLLEGTQEYNDLQNFAIEYAKTKGEYDSRQAKLYSLYKDIDGANIENEITSDIVGEYLFTDEQFVQKLSTEQPNVFKKIYNYVKHLYSMATAGSKEARQLEQLKYNFEKAYNASNTNVTSENARYHVSSTFSSEIDKALNNEMKKSSQVKARDYTPEILVENGVKDLPMLITQRHLKTIIYTEAEAEKLGLPLGDSYNYHGLGKDTLIKSIDNLDNPSEIYKKDDNHYIIITEIKDTNGDKIIVPIKIDGKGNYNDVYIDENQIKSVYGKKNLEKYLAKNKFENIYKKNETTLNEGSQSSNISSSINNIISQNDNVVKKSDNQGRTLTKEQQEYFKNVSPKLKDENNNLKVFYHGTARADRVGTVFDPNRATSGPMAFFTDNQEIAESYSKNKQDTSISREVETEYDLFKINGKSLDDYWKSLTKEQQSQIAKEGYNIGLDDDFENIVHEENASKNSFSNQYDYYLKYEEKGNAIRALYDVFIQDGNLMFEDMQKFQDVLKYAGINNVTYLDQYKTDSKVYEVYLNVTNPFDTSEITQDIISELEKVARKAPLLQAYNADQWDKTNIKPIDWINRLKEDYKNGTTHAWTSIPDFVTNYLKSKGYDGIVDVGGKNGGVGHQVAIPFYSNQIKNVDNINPTVNDDINLSLSAQNEDIAPTGSYNIYGENVKPRVEETIAPLKDQINELNEKLKNNTNVNINGDGTVSTSVQIQKDSNYVPVNMKMTQNQNKKLDAEITEQQNQKIAKILTEEPATENNRNKRKMAIIMANVLDKGLVFENLSLKNKNRDLMGKWDYTLTSEARAQNVIGNGNYEYDVDTKTTRRTSKSLNDIRSEVENSGNTQAFYDYMYHKHNVDRMNLQERYGIENKPVFGDSVTAEQSQKIVNQYENTFPEFMDYAQDVYDYVNADRQQLVKSGIISQETADLWNEMYPHYVPIRRAGHTANAINVPLDTGRTGVNAPIKKSTGGNSDILPLFDTMAQRTLQTYRATAKNNFGVELKNTLNSTIDSQQTTVDEVIDSIDTQEELLQEGKNGKNPTFTVFENGEKITYEITEDMYDALKPLSDSSLLSKTIKPLNVASSVHRGVLTEYNPVFMLTNSIKDAQDVLINSQHAFKTYAKFGEAYAQILKKGYWYQEYVANGGEQNSYFDSQENTFNTERKGVAKVLDTFPLKTISDLNNIIEMAPRLAEYIASREAGRSIEVSMLDSARVTTNFKAGGNLTKALNRNGFTFLNASVQGAMQQVRNIREANMNGLKGWANLATKFAVASLPALLLNALLWDDDEEYEELSDYVKQNYYIIGKDKNGDFIRIPKGRTLAVIQNAVEQMGNLITGNDEADLGTFLELVVSNLAPNNPLENNILSPITQVVNNKTWYGEDLVPTRLQDLPASEQFDESTDSFSKWLGEQLNISPYKINYILDQYTGGVGDVILPMMTPEAENGDDSLIGNVLAPLKSKFTTNSTMNNKNTGDFYELSEKLTTEAKKSTATDKDVLKNKYINSVKTEMNELYKKKREIQNSNLTDSEKYNQVLEIQEQINNLAKKGLNNYKNVTMESDYSKVGGKEYYKNNNGEWSSIKEEEAEELNNLNMTSKEKNNYFIAKNSISDIRENADSDEKKTRTIEAVLDSGLNDDQMAYLYDKYYGSTEKLYVVNKTGIGMTAYLNLEYQNFVSDKDEDGKTVSGSKKEKIFDYINDSDLDFEQKAILAKMYYNSYDEYNYEIIDYLNNNENISYSEMEEILKTLGFEVDKDGNITWE